MSHVLSALRKAEKERRRGRGLSLDDLGSADWQAASPDFAARRNWVLPLLAVLSAVLIAIGFWWFWGQNSGDARIQAIAPAEPPALEVEPPVPQKASSQEAAPATSSASSVQLPESLEVEGHIYVEGRPELNRVFIGGRGYRAGESYRGDIRVESIDSEGFRLTKGDKGRHYPAP